LHVAQNESIPLDNGYLEVRELGCPKDAERVERPLGELRRHERAGELSSACRDARVDLGECG